MHRKGFGGMDTMDNACIGAKSVRTHPLGKTQSKVVRLVIDRPQGSCGVWDIPRCYEAKPSNPKGIPYTTASEESMWLVPQLTAFHQSQAKKSIPLGNTFGFRQLREQRFEKCGLCPITLHFSRPLIGWRQATVVQERERAFEQTQTIQQTTVVHR